MPAWLRAGRIGRARHTCKLDLPAVAQQQQEPHAQKHSSSAMGTKPPPKGSPSARSRSASSFTAAISSACEQAQHTALQLGLCCMHPAAVPFSMKTRATVRRTQCPTQRRHQPASLPPSPSAGCSPATQPRSAAAAHLLGHRLHNHCHLVLLLLSYCRGLADVTEQLLRLLGGSRQLLVLHRQLSLGIEEQVEEVRT